MNSGNGATDDAFGNTDEWQPIDYWYNRVLSKSSPAANTANPSALGLIAFGYTTALLQVGFTRFALLVVLRMLLWLF
jgi:succinate-acetate transporter protein